MAPPALENDVAEVPEGTVALLASLSSLNRERRVGRDAFLESPADGCSTPCSNISSRSHSFTLSMLGEEGRGAEECAAREVNHRQARWRLQLVYRRC